MNVLVWISRAGKMPHLLESVQIQSLPRLWEYRGLTEKGYWQKNARKEQRYFP